MMNIKNYYQIKSKTYKNNSKKNWKICKNKILKQIKINK